MRTLILLVLLSITAQAADPVPCGWYGAAPFCFGQCPSGYKEVLRSDTGKRKAFGKSCLLGTKVFCCADGYLPKYDGKEHKREE